MLILGKQFMTYVCRVSRVFCLLKGCCILGNGNGIDYLWLGFIKLYLIFSFKQLNPKTENNGIDASIYSFSGLFQPTKYYQTTVGLGKLGFGGDSITHANPPPDCKSRRKG